MSQFAPVALTRPLDGRVSLTFLRHFSRCRRSGLLYQETRGSAQTVEMMRGSVVHRVNELGTNAMVETDNVSMPPELLKAIVEEVLAESPLPIEEHDYVRECSYRWASHFVIEPASVIATETLVVWEVGGYQVRCKVDFAELRNAGLLLYVGDYKSGKGAPPADEVTRKRTDGTISAKNLQLILYALALVHGRAVRVESCLRCGGTGRVVGELISASSATPEKGAERKVIETVCPDCPDCRHGRIETVEPLPLAPRAQEVIAEFIYPGIKSADGTMYRQTMGLTALELEEYRQSIEAILQGVAHAERTGDWPALISDAACDECPCSARCPIPAELRDHRGTINTLEELVEAASVYHRESQELKARRREIKATAKKLGEGPTARVRFGLDRVWEFGELKESTEIPDKEGMFAAVQEAIDFGTPFDPGDWVKVSRSTPFGERKLTEDELEEEANARERAAQDG